MMEKYVIMLGIAVLLIVLGALNMKGNVSSLHSYHRRRVSEEDRLPFGKKVGLGTVICGGGMAAYAVCGAVSEKINVAALLTLGAVLLVIGLVVGLGLSIYALIKYNKGIF